MTTKKKDEPFSMNVNFTINADNIKNAWHKIKFALFIIGGSGIIAHGTFRPNFYLGIAEKFGILLASMFK